MITNLLLICANLCFLSVTICDFKEKQLKTLAVFIIQNYKKYISPFLPCSCRFHPSCSGYCLEAV